MTYTKEEARAKIAKLVEDFRTHEATLEKAAEAQIENNFIRPLFRYLNWNTENEGLSHAHYEFKVQVTNKKGLRPDYILNLDGRDVLVMDAKQVKYSMKDPRWLYQVYSYAYSTQNSKPSEKMDFAILTDFQEFIVLDCTLFAAKPEAVNNFRVIDWKYTDYVDKFDELWELFERNHVMDDSRPSTSPPKTGGSAQDEERGLWSRYLSPQKVKANRVAPDKAFLAQMDDEKDGWRVLLAKDMKRLNPFADGELITAAVQLLIDRLIFIKALSDREVDRDYLSEIKARVTEAGLGAAQRDAGWFSSCKTIFEELNNFYNGSIFAPRPELENVSVSNKVVQAVITDLQPENSPYNFAVLPVEILGTIYERFLGRVVRTTEKQVKIEEKPEVRKAGGVYYTPQYIVDYIVENTLGSLLKDCKTPADAARLKVLDPSCGSGSFLLGAYDKLIEWHKDYFARAGKEKRDRESFYRDESGGVRLTAKLKRDILKNNLFGVDIDPQAVEVTRFSLSLKALEDLREGELTEERTLFHQTVLPDLSQNIKNGNSLIGSEYFAGQMFADAVEMKRVNAFDWKLEFPEIMKNGGFDAIVGNPPYIRIQTLKEWAPLEVEIYKEAYQSAKAGNYDIYVVFVEKALSLLNERGRMGYILPHKFFNSQYGAGLRGQIASGKHIGKVIHFGDQQVFDGATTYTCLLFLDKKANDDFEMVRVQDLDAWREQAAHIQTSEVLKTSEVSGRIPAVNVTAAEWNFTVGEGAGLFEKLSQMPVKLGDVASIFVGLQTSADTVFLFKDTPQSKKPTISVNSKELDKTVVIETGLLKPVIRSGEIGRYWANPSALVIFPYETSNSKSKLISETQLKSNFPKTWDYLVENKKLLSDREHGKFKDTGWYQLYPKNLDTWEQPKIMLPYMITRLSAYYDEDSMYFVNVTTGGFGVTLDEKFGSPKYVTGLLNSTLLDWFMKRVSTSFHGGYFAANKQFLVQLPIRTIDFNIPAEKAAHEKMVSLVEQMVALYKSKAGARTQAEIDVYERQIRAVDESIDTLVYELYGLTEEEVKIITNQT
ncbi:MAG: Eco57I restriction-modification methylase domain-containing protein [Chloroflexi bacterium]|nr:Eco57I restriction-modification methylase domain-containing protein [Chloroflexota bacterium]